MKTNPTRRQFLKAVAGGLAIVSCSETLLAGKPSNKPPNLLFVFPDQMRGQALGFMNEDPVITPNLDRFAGESVLSTTANNGFAAGTLVSFSVGPSGDVTGIFSNGTNRTIAQVALADFTNPGGLQKSGANMYEASANSGQPRIGTPGSGGRGTNGSGVLEGSNTDLAREFTNVVIAQRGFQASSRIISTADQMLQDLVSLTR